MQKLEEIMELGKLDKDQLVQLCNALYALLEKREVQVQVLPAQQPFVFSTPYVPPMPSYPTYPNLPTGGTTASTNETTQQERFGNR